MDIPFRDTVLIRGPTIGASVAVAGMLASAACHSPPAREYEGRAQLEAVVGEALAAERAAFVRGDADAALRESGLDTAHWPAVRPRLEEAVRRRELLVQGGHDYHAVLEARTTVDSARVGSDSATLWVTALGVYAQRGVGGDTTTLPAMGEAVPHVLAFTRWGDRWVLVRDSIVSLAELHRHGARPNHRDGEATDASTWTELPPPSWRVVARREGKALLAAERVIVRGIRRRDDSGRGTGIESAREYPTLVFEDGRLRDGPPARAGTRITEGAARDTLRLHSLELLGRQVLFAQAGEAPTLHESPAEPGLYVLEHDDRLWLLSGSDVVQLTADTSRGVARDTLRSRTREEGPHLYWAANPLWSPDGSSIAYVTNRTWMLGREGGQEVWLADVRSRRERPLLSAPGERFAPSGWLGPELVYTTREGGISAVDARTGTRRTIARGAAVAFSPLGSRLLYMTSAGDTVRAHVLTERGTVDVPHPPPGERLDHAGAFSPNGDRLVLGTSFARDSGMTRALYLLELGAARLTKLSEWSFRDGSRHPQGLPVWLDDATLLLTRFDRGTGLESSALVRLPPR